MASVLRHGIHLNMVRDIVEGGADSIAETAPILPAKIAISIIGTKLSSACITKSLTPILLDARI